jgi:hypothetical protein
MTGRPGFFGGPHQGDGSERDASYGRAADSFADDSPGSSPSTNFDPVWGTLGAPSATSDDPWFSGPHDPDEGGPTVDVDIFGDGFEIAGQIRAGQFSRLSDWLNMQQGFVPVQNASIVHLGHGNLPDQDHESGTLWLRLDKIVLVAERADIQPARPGAVVVQKERRRVTIVTPGYSLKGNLHVHAYGSMKQVLESPDPHFLALTELAVRRLTENTLVIRFPFALVNREQLISILDDNAAPAGESANPGRQEALGDEAEMPLSKRWGAA